MNFLDKLNVNHYGSKNLLVSQEVSDTKNSALMALDFVGTALESKSDNPVTIGGCANKRYREYMNSFVPDDYEPGLERDIRTQQYFKAMGIQAAKSNVYVAWAVTFPAWLLLPITQLINLGRFINARLRN